MDKGFRTFPLDTSAGGTTIMNPFVPEPIPPLTPYPTFAITWLRGHKVTLVVAPRFGETVLYIPLDKKGMVKLLRAAKKRHARFESHQRPDYLHIRVFE